MKQLEIFLNKASELAAEFIPKMAGAIFVIIIGFWLVRRIANIAQKTLAKSSFSPEISSFLVSLINLGLKVLILLSAAGIVGFETTSIVAVLAAAGFAVGLALQGSLSNFSAGILILVFRPYKVGDWIGVEDFFGKVEEIQIFNTIIVTPGQKTLYIPNGQVIDNVLTNYSAKGHIRLELNITMPYAESFPKVKNIIVNALAKIPEVLEEPQPEIGIETFDSHSVVIAVRPFVKPDDFWEITFKTHQVLKEAFSTNKIQVAYSEGVEMGNIGA
jgi:small conductance mechanosensitive channel